ncbi:MAG: sigma 54-interacting transcriptional regulator, partial [Clostridia bacterium]|nr:sigma 54-interacting transcriptional regulator [Clostridia bacterium]
GYERGAFTDARKEGKPGRIELAHGGTLFLDEVGELPYGLQAKLLNVLQDRRVMRLGGLKSKEVDFRLIAATNRDLEEMVEKGRFRQDLFYRLNIIRIHVPPLRERKDDILALTAHFLRVYGNRYGLRKIASNQVIEYLLEYGWPGNVRELANVIEQLVVMSEGEVITMDDLLQISSFQKRADEINSGSKSPKTLKEALEEYERKLITEALETYPTLREAAESLGIDISTLVRKKAKLNIKTRKSR